MPLLVCDHFDKCTERDMCRRARPGQHSEYKCPFHWEAKLVRVRIGELNSSILCELHSEGRQCECFVNKRILCQSTPCEFEFPPEEKE